MKLPMNLQTFAEGDPAPAPGGITPPAATQTTPAAAQIDYDRIAQLVAGKQTVAENDVLKNYFKQQGLSQDEMKQAISTFKAQQAAQQPDVNALQTQLSQAQAAAQQAMIENAATMQAIELGLDSKTIPYALKMADLSKAIGEDGKINAENVKNALNKVLEDVPALKPVPASAGGFQQVGAGAGSGQQQTNTGDALKAAFGL